MKPEKDFYQILGIQRDASEEEVRKAYRTYAAKFHPDKHEGDSFFADRFQEVKDAYETLSDMDKRVKYDVKKFGRSKVIRSVAPDHHDQNGVPKPKPRRGLRVDVSHLDIYMSLFYLINLAAWVMIRRMAGLSTFSTGGHTWSLFLCCVSTLLMWLFIRSLINFRNNRFTGKPMLLVVYLVLSLLFGIVPLVTNWIR